MSRAHPRSTPFPAGPGTSPHGVPLDHQPWSPRRWMVSILAVFLLQTLVLIYLSRHQGEDPPTVPLRTELHLAAEPWSAHQLALLQTYRDPTLFALPNINSFSGDGWLKFHPMEHHFLDWDEAPPWLELEEADLGNSFHQYIDRSASSPLRITDQAMPPRPGVELLVPNLPMPDQSSLRLEGDLAGRILQEPIRLRSWQSADLLSNTVVRVVIDGNGQVFSVTLAQTSGLLAADRYALNIAQTARFTPPPPSPQSLSPDSPQGMTWGRMVFQWLTLPPQEGTDSAQPNAAAIP